MGMNPLEGPWTGTMELQGLRDCSQKVGHMCTCAFFPVPQRKGSLTLPASSERLIVPEFKPTPLWLKLPVIQNPVPFQGVINSSSFPAGCEKEVRKRRVELTQSWRQIAVTLEMHQARCGVKTCHWVLEREIGGHPFTGTSQPLKEKTDEGTDADTPLSTVHGLPEATTPPCCPAWE